MGCKLRSGARRAISWPQLVVACRQPSVRCRAKAAAGERLEPKAPGHFSGVPSRFAAKSQVHFLQWVTNLPTHHLASFEGKVAMWITGVH
jgi:hypothetical protein